MKTIQIISLAIFCLLFGTPVLSADDYLSALEEEAEDTGSTSVATRGAAVAAGATATATKKKAVVVGKDSIRSGLSFDEFEDELETNYSGSHFLYVKLKQRQRKAVFTFYQGNNKVEPIRQEIVRQLSSG